jgi:GTPase SAR1 family protein
VFAGSEQIGKSCIVLKAMDGSFTEEANPTLGASHFQH